MPTPATSARLYLYAIVDNNAALDSLPAGLDGKPVTLVSFGELAAVVGEVELSALNDTVSAAVIHEDIVEKILEQRRVLPVRFGTIFSSRQAMFDALDAHYPQLVADLARLDGQVELGLRVFWDPAVQVADATDDTPISQLTNIESPGIAYLRTRFAEAAQERTLRRMATAVEVFCRQMLEPLCTDLQVNVLLTAAIPVSAACLLPRAAVDEVVAKVATLQASRTDLRFVCTGPWPPYHFIADTRGKSS